MRRPMPPLNALKAFEATARHLSFTKAAAELHVTPAALSHQIRGLEDLLGLKLFFRRARAIELTDAARLIYPGIQTGFESLRAAVERLEPSRQDRVLVVSATPGLTAKWLAPRLYRFLGRHPDIDTRISASSAYVNFAADGVDVGIRLSSGNHPELYVEKLSDEWLLPLCSPRLLDGAHPLRSPKDLVHFTLIQVDLPGVVLAYKVVASRDIGLGRLIVPFGPEIALPGRSYFFVCQKGHEKRAPVKAFRDWAFAEIADTAAILRQATAGIAAA